MQMDASRREGGQPDCPPPRNPPPQPPPPRLKGNWCSTRCISPSMMFGITRHNMMKLGYDIAERNGFVHCFNKHKQRAGKDRFFSFMKRHPNLSMHKPQAMSLARSSGFNKEAVGDYFNILENVLDENKFPVTRIYNVDETGQQFRSARKCCSQR